MDLDVDKPAPHHSTTASESQSTSNLDSWISKLFKLEQLTESDVARLCEIARDVLQEESNVQAVVSPFITRFHLTLTILHPPLLQPPLLHPHPPPPLLTFISL